MRESIALLMMFSVIWWGSWIMIVYSGQVEPPKEFYYFVPYAFTCFLLWFKYKKSWK